MRKLLTLAAAMTLCTSADNPGSSNLFQAIRNGDSSFIKTHLNKAELEARDPRGATPLMHAAAFGDVQTVRLLLDAGADVNARNQFDATALLWSARDPEKAKLLLERGADVNVASTQGRTPLMVACLRPGGADIVAMMLNKGADVNARDGRRGSTALMLASSIGDAEIMKLLLAKGADPNAVDRGGQSAIIGAASSGRIEPVQLLIAKGADVKVFTTSSGPPVKNGPINRMKITALHNAAGRSAVDVIHALLKAGAPVNAVDSRGLTPLHFALATDYPSVVAVQTLLRAGADVNARDTSGETPLDWAEKFGDPQVIGALKKSGAKNSVAFKAPVAPREERPTPDAAVARSVKLLQASGAEFFKRSGCVGCHHQPLIARAQAAAARAGISHDDTLAKEQFAQMRGQWLALQEEFLQTLNPGGGANRLAENLLGLMALGYAPDTITDSAIVDVADSQELDGSWAAGEVQARPPIAESVFASTARAIEALKAYGVPARQHEFANRIRRARAWLNQAKPLATEDFAMRLRGLALAGATTADLQRAAKDLLSQQHPDGGWSRNRFSPSDAYQTGGALLALAMSGVVKPADATYRRGIDYLLLTQFPDGSWFVRSRAIKFQPYFESAFPFGHDQWISIAATAWATQAIALSLPPRT